LSNAQISPIFSCFWLIFNKKSVILRTFRRSISFEKLLNFGEKYAFIIDFGA